MIDDPVEFIGKNIFYRYNNFMEEKAGQNVFVNLNRTLIYGRVELFSKSLFVNYVWKIDHSITAHSYWICGLPRYDKENFIDLISKHHPIHFEWLLFHPEWLD